MLCQNCYYDQRVWIALLVSVSLIAMWYFVFAATATRNQEGIVSNSIVYFTSHVPVNTVVGGPEPLKLKKILDMVSL